MTLTNILRLPITQLRSTLDELLGHITSRPAVSLCIGLVLAIVVTFQQSLWISITVMLMSCTLVWVLYRGRRTGWLLLPCVGFASGMLLAIPQMIITQRQIAGAKPGYGMIEGLVVGEPDRLRNSVAFTLCITKELKRLPINTPIRVSSFQPGSISINPGQRVRCQLEWHRVTHDKYDRWLWLRGIYLKGTLISDRVQVIGQQSLRVQLSFIRQHCLDGLTRSLPGEAQGLVKGIALGDTGGISTAQKKKLADTGVIHILSPSGLHVSIVFGFMWIVMGLLSVPRWLRITMSLIAVWMYALICGAEAPAVRSAIMCSVAGLAQWAHRDRDALSACAVAAMLILAWQPMCLIDPSFQMSFVMVSFVLVIASSMPHHRYTAGFWQRVLSRTTELAIIGILCAFAAAPLSAFYFGRVSVISPLTNILVSLPVTIITCLAPVTGWLSAVGLTAIADILSWPLRMSVSWLTGSVDACIRLPFNSINATTPSAFMMIVYYSCYLLLLTMVRLRKGRVQPVVT